MHDFLTEPSMAADDPAAERATRAEEPEVRLVLRNRVFLAVDVMGWLVLPLLALAIRLDGIRGLAAYLPHLAAFTLVAVAVKATFLWLFGVYRRYWRYASVDDLLLIVAAVTTAGLAVAALYLGVIVPLWAVEPRLPRSLPLLDGLLTLFYVGGTRFAVRSADHVVRKLAPNGHRKPVLVVGAGGTGTLVVRDLLANPRLGLEPVAFLDDNPEKLGNSICGLPVLGSVDALPEVTKDYGIETVIIAMPSAPGRVIRQISGLCERARVTARTVPGLFEILSGRVGVTALRQVQIEDLLRREPVRTDKSAVARLVRGATVLVTGAGGSIGAEICRQVAEMGAAELVLLGKGENSIFEIHTELSQTHPRVQAVPVIADVRDWERVRRVFETYRPRIVFHAAAHKHVPLMELNPEEAVTANVLGTRHVLEAAETVGVVQFVFISTDKAVNPVNVMGATKLLAERLVHDAAERLGGAYVSVRFGNVLASRGSVVPAFQRQIARGGPLTVTHQDTTRYFMTIPEAVQLVLQAAVLGRGGETFLLDMGQPVRILDLAKDLIHLSGYEVDRDIEIVFTGLRPGEKLVEELYTTGDRIDRTEHSKIFVVRNGAPPPVNAAQLQHVIDVAQKGDALRLRSALAAMVPEYSGDDAEEAAGAPPGALAPPAAPGREVGAR